MRNARRALLLALLLTALTTAPAGAQSRDLDSYLRRALAVLTVYTRHRVNSFTLRTAPVYPICDCFPIPCPAVPAFALLDVRDRCRWPVECEPGSKGGPVWTSYRRTTERRVREIDTLLGTPETD